MSPKLAQVMASCITSKVHDLLKAMLHDIDSIESQEVHDDNMQQNKGQVQLKDTGSAQLPAESSGDGHHCWAFECDQPKSTFPTLEEFLGPLGLHHEICNDSMEEEHARLALESLFPKEDETVYETMLLQGGVEGGIGQGEVFEQGNTLLFDGALLTTPNHSPQLPRRKRKFSGSFHSSAGPSIPEEINHQEAATPQLIDVSWLHEGLFSPSITEHAYECERASTVGLSEATV